ncbi:MAG: hypothetical protein WAP23_02940 [Candidatus Spechtbacterales bacterium]
MDTNYTKYKIIKFVKKISLWHIILALAAGSFIFYGYLFLNRSSFSASSVSFSIEGPETFKAQEKVEFEIKIKNKSKFNLHNTLVYVALPEFLSPEGGNGGGQQRIDFEDIKANGYTSKKISVFSNETEREGDIKVRAEYTPGNLSGIYESSANIKIFIASLPLTVIFDIPQKAVNGQQIRGSFHFVAEGELESLPLAARMIMPEGFTLKDAEPKPKDTSTWEFLKVEQKETYEVEFEGVISGQESETKKFVLLFGNLNEETGFSEQYRISREVRISSAPLEFSQTANGKSEYIASPGEKLNFRVDYANKSGVDIDDVSITAQLSGDAFDFSTLDTGLGYFNNNTKVIIWNKNFVADLSRLDKGEGGNVGFSVSLKKDIAPKTYRDKNVFIKSTAVIDSRNLPLALKGLSLRAENVFQVKVRTLLELSSNAYYYEGPFSNSGPIPPKIGEKTTYTISWKIKNSFNEASDVRVEAPLSGRVAFEGKTYPLANKLIYNPETHSVAWDVGGLSWGVGYAFPLESAAFQVSITPTEEMRGQVVELIEQAKISGQDTFVDEFIEAFAAPLDTTLPNDVGIRQGDGVVQ